MRHLSLAYSPLGQVSPEPLLLPGVLPDTEDKPLGVLLALMELTVW